MKHSRDQQNKQSKQGITKKPKPEIRDNLDSRENKEQGFKDGNNRNENQTRRRKHDN